MIAPLLLAAVVTTASVHRAVSTQSAQAQLFFDRGLTSFYAYDRDGAAQAFANALHADPQLAMAAWGEALAAAADLNHPLSPDSFTAAQTAVKQAVSLETFASVPERAYIDALALRYAGSWDNRETNEQRYIQAMEAIVAQHPLDDDAAVLTAEALLEDREPPARALALLQPVLLRQPLNVMVNHLCIHAYELLPDVTPAIPCADRLHEMTFLPQHEHLAHMPAHTYTEAGQYAKAVAASERAWNLRQAWIAAAPPYELQYGPHDASVGYAAAMMLGDQSIAQTWETRVAAQMQTAFHLTTLARFAQWTQVITQAGQPDSHRAFTLGLAYAHLGNLSAAEEQLTALRRDALETEYGDMLDAAIQERRGNVNGAVASLQRAIVIQKRDYTAEYIPLFPAGEMLGALYLRAGRYFEARSALQQSLGRYPGDPRALYALVVACGRIGDGPCANSGRLEFEEIWHGPPPNIDDL